MANYYEKSRTNHFRVTDEGKWSEFMRTLRTSAELDEDDRSISDISRTDEDGVVWHAFCVEGIPLGSLLTEDGKELCVAGIIKDMLPEGEACIIQTIGCEKLRYLVGECTVVTKDGVLPINMGDVAIGEARKMLNNPEWATEMDY